MALFDNNEEAEIVVNEGKSRLFETHQRTERSVHDYLKVLAPVLIVVIVIGGAFVFFTMPGTGDEVRAPAELDQAVKTYFLDNEKRAVTEATYFYCGDFYSARVLLEQRPDITARQFDHGSRRVIAMEGQDGPWQISSAVIDPSESADPCSR